jgi:hypothetical protein
MSSHLYQVGQTVRLAAHAGPNLEPSATYKIAMTLPEVGTEPQYRVKGDHERFERVVREFQIVSLDPSPPPSEAEKLSVFR